jgi:hypothetical protein
MRLSSFTFFLAPWLALAGTARAEASAQHSWTRGEGAETCATRAEIARRVAARLGRDPFVVRAGEDSLALEGLVDRAPGGAYRARIYAEPAGCASAPCPRVVRELTGDAASCASLDGAVVLALALTIDPSRAREPSPPAPRAPSAPAATAHRWVSSLVSDDPLKGSHRRAPEHVPHRSTGARA